MINAMSDNYGTSGGSKLVRPKEGRMVAGVCAGLAAYFKADVSIVRLLFGLFTFFGGIGALTYVIAWAILPEEGEGRSIVESFIDRHQP
jgi:phage shock protein PspC (stress-responsive transcriptional regulator)